MVDDAIDDQIVIVTSAWTLVEIVRTDGGEIISPESEQKIVKFFKNDFIEIRPIDRKIGEVSRYLQRSARAIGMRMPKADSVHLATAMSVPGLLALYTFDEKDLVPHDEKWGDPPVKICLPPLPLQQELFEKP